MSDSTIRRTRWRMDAFDFVVFAGFLALSMWTVVVLVAQQTPHKLWTETNGPFFGDQMMYLGWIQDSAHHVLIGDPFRTTTSPHDYLHPGVVLSGILVRLGVSVWLAYLVWVPIAAVAFFVAARGYVRRLVTGTARRRCALVLALFYISPVSELADRFHGSQQLGLRAFSLAMWPGFYLWGYPFTAIAVALMVGTLIAYERDRRDGAVRLWAPTCALLCAWLQPWQGATVIVILLVSEALLWRRNRRASLVLPVATVAAASVPLGYYFLLSHLDAAWALSGRVNLESSLPLDDILIAVLPLGAFAVLAYRGFASTFQDFALREWPVGAFAVVLFIQLTHIGTFPPNALQGLSIPFAVLAVIGASRLHLALPMTTRVILGAVVVAALIGQPVVRELYDARNIATPTVFGSQPFFINPSERDALNYLNRSPTKGAVLSPVYLGQIIPAETGRQTWVGIASWTPDYQRRTEFADELFSGKLSPSASVELIRSSGARLLLADCQHHTNLKPVLGSILQSERRFGCATVYIVRSVR